ncbi:Cell adhesion molecule 1 [Takifugu flavidus]|uniref:Cell adhesion molecule 1 n=1 Tax=Takifugu flavidus TaxID=433684 RepID=A0A5C6P901_9TELE|nr:Cell adhesion molecule 1 [Takifugu flavidus]
MRNPMMMRSPLLCCVNAIKTIVNRPTFCIRTYFTHEAKGADDAADADTAIINAEGGHTNSEEKKEYYI